MKAHDSVKEIEARLKDLGTQVDMAKSGAQVLDYLKFISVFHKYSFHNTLSIWYHKPEATNVAGFHTWRKLGRWVKSGETGIPILAPCSVQKKAVNAEDTAPATTFFKVVYVFDVSQTEGRPLPEAPPITVSGEGRGLLPLLESLAHSKGLQVSYVVLPGDHHGSAYADGRIEIGAALDDAGRASVLCHELTHSLCHFGHDRSETTAKQREIEAEVTSHIVTTHFGLESQAPNYLALWDVTGEDVLLSFKRIHATAAEMIAAIATMKSPGSTQECA